MNNPTIETDLAQILGQINQKLDKLNDNLNELKTKDITEIKVNQAKLQGQVEAIDQKLSGRIEALDQKLSGRIEALDTKVEQLDKRLGNQEFANRGILVGIVVIVLGGAAKLFGWVGNIN